MSKDAGTGEAREAAAPLSALKGFRHLWLCHGFVLYFPHMLTGNPVFPNIAMSNQAQGKYRVEGENIREIQVQAMS